MEYRRTMIDIDDRYLVCTHFAKELKIGAPLLALRGEVMDGFWKFMHGQSFSTFLFSRCVQYHVILDRAISSVQYVNYVNITNVISKHLDNTNSIHCHFV